MPENSNGQIELGPLTKHSLTWNLPNIRSAIDRGDQQAIERSWKYAKDHRHGHFQASGSIESTLFEAILKAIDMGRVDGLKWLIKCDTKILAIHDGANGTVLHRAVEKGNEDIVILLLGHSRIIKGIDAKDGNGRTALHKAAYQDQQLGILRHLLASRAEIDTFDQEHITPLHLAVLQHQPHEEQVVNFLIEYGAMVNTRDNSGEFSRQKVRICCPQWTWYGINYSRVRRLTESIHM